MAQSGKGFQSSQYHLTGIHYVTGGLIPGIVDDNVKSGRITFELETWHFSSSGTQRVAVDESAFTLGTVMAKT